ncbi:hypothetical protein QIA34_04950 (plasmid) [Borreliella yangtzensis]|uniref:Peptidoglycan hydrolase CwlO-like protein n=1 Tax=Borreliella yangtzensis TaxID=683292 RepID=A0ABR6PAY5_9SPIR|nr:peptidoglycan hydrolase CwlO-like protein [Borreliella yangtzensis]
MDFYNLIKDFGSLIGILVTLVSILTISYKFGGRLTKIDLELGNLKEDNKKLDTRIDKLDTRIDKLDTRIDNLDKRLLTLEVESKNLNNSVNEVRSEMKSYLNRVENRLDKIESRLEKSDERYMIFFTNRALDLLKTEKSENKNE